MGKKSDTIKVKRKCCLSNPACKRCPIVVLREALREAKAEEAKKERKKAKKASKKMAKHSDDNVPCDTHSVTVAGSDSHE